MKWFFATVTGLLILLVLIIANAPSSLIPSALAQMKSRGLMPLNMPIIILSNTDGTVWDGQATDVIVEIDGAQLQMGIVSWQLSPLSLLQQKPAIKVSSNAPEQNLQATITMNEEGYVSVDDLEGRLAISVLEPWIPMFLSGDIAFVIDHVRFKQRQLLALDGVLNLEYVDWIGGDYDMPLGSYMAQMSLQKSNNVVVSIDDFGASLGIDGLLSVNTENRSYQFKATLEPREDLASEVAESLIWLGKRDENGDVFVDRRGRF
jgi:hypothetical protein